MKWPTKSVFNFLIECVSLLVLMGMIATGLAMKFTLPPGSGLRTVQWGLSRHEWGDVHFWLAVALVCLIALHLLMHWRWIWTMALGQNPRLRRARGIVFIILTLIILAMAALPWIVPVESAPGGGGRGRGYHGGRADRPTLTQPRTTQGK
ncbi:DUF4405 domain-containing protein [bacterium]|nr:DUF4405 domain-containing protein [bacterium]